MARYFLTFMCVFAGLVRAQEQRYSSRPAIIGGGGPHGPGKTMKNALSFTADGEFLRIAADDNAMAIDLIQAAKTSGDATVRAVAAGLLAERERIGSELRRLGARKHVILPSGVPSTTQRRPLGSGGDALSSAGQLRILYRVEIPRYEREAESGSDADIKKWASDQLKTLDRQEALVNGRTPNDR